MRSALFGTHAEAVASRPGMALQNSTMLKATLDGELIARRGSLVAYQGHVDFRALRSGGIARYVQQRLTGEGVPLMSVTGRGEVFLSDLGSEVFLVDLEGPDDALTINGRNVLAFEPSLRWDVQLVPGTGALSSAGLFNCVFTGRGRIAITCKGTPVVVAVDEATYAEVRSEKLGELAAEFDAIHSVGRAVEVGSVDRIIPAAELRPQLVEAVERGIERALAQAATVV